MNKEIGSTFWIDPSLEIKSCPVSPKILSIAEKKVSFVSTCRSAIGLALDSIVHLKNKRALLPGFTCESVLTSFLKREFEVYPYSVGRDLCIHWESIQIEIERLDPGVLLIHRYFGFDSCRELEEHLDYLKAKGIVIIEDMTQSMFSSFRPLNADYHVGSIRKWMALPDGAFVTSSFRGTEDLELVESKLQAFKMKGDWIVNGKGEKSKFFDAYSKAESLLDSRKEPHRMSGISRSILSSVNIQSMIQARLANCQYLIAQILRDKVLMDNLELPFNSLDNSICPFHLPLLVISNRKELQQWLVKNSIFATIIWGCPKEYENKIDDSTRYIYDHILCIHIDQRYDLDDMNRIVIALKNYYQSPL